MRVLGRGETFDRARAYSVLCSCPMASAVSWFKYRPVRAIQEKPANRLLFGFAEADDGSGWGSIGDQFLCEGLSQAPMSVRKLRPCGPSRARRLIPTGAGWAEVQPPVAPISKEAVFTGSLARPPAPTP
jgi:hypothetical protein